MKSLFSPIFSLVVCSVLFFGSAECGSSTVVLPSPTAGLSSTGTYNISSALNTGSPNASTVHVTPTPNMTSIFTTSVPNKTIISSVLPNTSIIASASHLPNSSVHNSSMYVTLTSMIMSSSAGNSSIHNSTSSMYVTLTSVIMSSSAGNGSIHNSTIHPTPLPTHSINMSSTVIQNASSHILPTMTPSPSPATSVFPSTSVPPTTPTPLPKGKYSVSKNGTKCLLLWLSLKFTITYKNNSGNKVPTKQVVMPSTGTADGTCEESLSSIRVSWPFYSFEAYFHTMKGHLDTAEASNAHWTTANITITAQTTNNSDFVNANDTIIKQSVTKPGELEWLSGHLGRSLNCSVDKNLKTESMTATVEDLRVQPFEVHNGNFAEAESCKSTPTKPPTEQPKKNKSSNTVAIAVGCSLAGLVLIVLIGYFIGKRRKQASTGYRKL